MGWLAEVMTGVKHCDHLGFPNIEEFCQALHQFAEGRKDESYIVWARCPACGWITPFAILVGEEANWCPHCGNVITKSEILTGQRANIETEAEVKDALS